MVNACPAQSDPRLNVANFISNDSNRALPGLVTEGLESLMNVIRDEIKKQEPDTNIVYLDRDALCDNDITFGRDLQSFLEKEMAKGKKVNLLIVDDLPVVGWNMVMEKFKGSDMQVYYGTLACRQVPLCTKLF